VCSPAGRFTGSHIESFIDARQVNLKSRAVIEFTVDGDVPAALFDDAVASGEAEACAFPNSFVVKKGSNSRA